MASGLPGAWTPLESTALGLTLNTLFCAVAQEHWRAALGQGPEEQDSPTATHVRSTRPSPPCTAPGTVLYKFLPRAPAVTGATDIFVWEGGGWMRFASLRPANAPLGGAEGWSRAAGTLALAPGSSARLHCCPPPVPRR